MNIRTVLFAGLLVAGFLPAPRALAGEGFLPGAYGPEAAGRAGADTAVAGEATSLKTNPAALAWLRRNRSDINLQAFFNKLDLEAGPAGANHNGDEDFFTGNFAYAFIPSKLATDPFEYWSRYEEEEVKALTRRARYRGRLETTLSGLPRTLELKGSGLGFWVSDIVLRGRVRGGRIRARFVLPPLERLPEGRRAVECKATFAYRLLGEADGGPPSLTLTAYGHHETILLKGEPGAWRRQSIAMALQETGLPPRASLTAVSAGTGVELRDLVIFRTYLQGERRVDVRSPIEKKDVRIEEDPGLSTVILDTAPGPFRPAYEEDVLWGLEGPEPFRGEDLAGLVLEFRYGFEGGASKGSLALAVNGETADRMDVAPEAVEPSAKEEMEKRRATMDWLEREKVHLGVGVFTDAWIAADYGNLPSDAGEHEGQVRYGLYSAVLGGAVELHPDASVGLSVDAVHGRFFNLDGLFSQPASILGAYENAYRLQTGRDRVSLQVDADDLFTWGFGARLGALLRPVENLTLGATVHSPVYMGRHGGKATADFSDDFLFSGFDTWLRANVPLPLAGEVPFDGEYDAFITGFRLPLRASVGLAYRIADAVTVALDGTYIGWSHALDRLTLKFTRGSNPNTDTVVGRTFTARLPLRFQDQWVAALGVSADLHENLTVHAGWRYATNPVDEDAAHPLVPAHTQNVVALGATVRVRSLSFSLALQHGFDAKISTGDSLHGPLLDGSSFTIREEYAVLGVSYEY